MKIGFLRFSAARGAARLLALWALLHLAACSAPIEGDRLERLRADVKAAAPPAICIRAIGPRALAAGDRPADVTIPLIIQGTQVADFPVYDLYFKAAFVATEELRALGFTAALSPAIWGARLEGMRTAAGRITPEALRVALAEVGAQDDMPPLFLLDEDTRLDLYASRRTLLAALTALPLRTRVPRTVIVIDGKDGSRLEVDVQSALKAAQPLGSSGYTLRVDRQFDRFSDASGAEIDDAKGNLNEALSVTVSTPGGQSERRVLLARHPEVTTPTARLELPFHMAYRRIVKKPPTAREVRDAYFLSDDGDAPPVALDLDVRLVEAVAEESALSATRRAKVEVGARFVNAKSGAPLFDDEYDFGAQTDGTGASLERKRYVFTLGEDDPIERSLRLAIRAAVRDALRAIGRAGK